MPESHGRSMPLQPIEELGVTVADGLEDRFGERSWWNSLKAILFYGPVVLVAVYLIGFVLGIF